MIPLRALLNAKRGVLFDAVSVFMIVMAFFFFAIQMFIFLPNLTSPEALSMVVRSVICFSFLSGSIVMMMTTQTFVPGSTRFVDEHLSTDEMSMTIVLTIVDLLMITIINFITFKYTNLNAVFAITPNPLLSQVSFSFFVGITEEAAFRGFLLTYASNLSWSPLAIVIATLAWWIFHGGVYGLEAAPMIIIVASGFVISGSYVISGNRLSVPMLPHGINNVGSYLVQSIIQPVVSVILRLV